MPEISTNIIKDSRTSIAKLLGSRRNKIIALVLAFAIVMTATVQLTSAGTLSAIALAADQENCTSSKGTRVTDKDGTNKNNVITCQFSSGRFRPTEYIYNNTSGDWSDVITEFKLNGAADSETCIFVKSVGGDASIDIHALGDEDADKRNVRIIGDTYKPYCMTASILGSENQNSGFTVKSGTVRVSSILVSAKPKAVTPPVGVDITVCRDGNEITIKDTERRSSDTDAPCEAINNPVYIDVCRNGVEISIEESQRRSTDTDVPCNTAVELIDVCRDGKLITIDSTNIQPNDTDPPCSSTPPRSGINPWTVPNGTATKVELPNGLLTHESTQFVSASAIASNVDGIWRVNRSWDERVEGRAIDFGGSNRVILNGQSVRGFKIAVPRGISSNHLFDGRGTVSYGVITNSNQNAHNSIFHDSVNGNHYSLFGNVGDVLKPAENGVMTHSDAYWENDVLPGGPTDKHYDGFQAHSNGYATMKRIVIDWKNAGTIANTTAALFTQQQGGVSFGDILILNPGGTFQIVRLSGSGSHTTTGPIQVIGTQEKNNNFDKQTPTHLIKLTNGMNRNSITLYNDVPGAQDFLIE